MVILANAVEQEGEIAIGFHTNHGILENSQAIEYFNPVSPTALKFTHGGL